MLSQALIASLADVGAPTELIASWRQNSSELPGYGWMNDWLESAKRVFVVSAHEALEMMGDNNLQSEIRFLAAARLMSDQDAGVDRMFNAQIWIADWLGQSKMFWNYDVVNRFASHLADIWKKQCAIKATLRNPCLTVPEIERECDGKDEGIAKVSKILLAAGNAVTIQMTEEVRKRLQVLAASKSVNPYRFA
jgi:hypothetical protein